VTPCSQEWASWNCHPDEAEEKKRDPDDVRPAVHEQ
jgi:hypothetical protein